MSLAHQLVQYNYLYHDYVHIFACTYEFILIYIIHVNKNCIYLIIFATGKPCMGSLCTPSQIYYDLFALV